MGEVVGSLGEGPLVILQPALGTDDGVQLAIGLARWWCRRLRETGRRTTWFLLGVPGTSNPRHLRALSSWPPDHVGELLVGQIGARYGLAPEFTAFGTRAKITARLFEVAGEGRTHAIETWSFDADNLGIPAFAFEVVEQAALRLGTKAACASWSEAFESNDAIASLWYLTALGGVALLEDGFAPTADDTVAALVSAVRADPTMPGPVALMEEMLRAIAIQHGASELELAAIVRDARDAAGHAPAAWTGVVQRALAGST